MESINVPENITAKDFFENFVPAQFKAITSATPITGVDGIEFSLQFDIEGAGGGSWGIVVVDGKAMTIKPGGYDKALITMKLAEKDWRDAITGKAGFQMGMDMSMSKGMSGDAARQQFEILQNTKGKLIAEITKEDGSLFPVSISFNKAETPTTTIRMKMADYIEMQSGRLDGPMAFMQGKITIEGDMMFAMQLGQFRL